MSSPVSGSGGEVLVLTQVVPPQAQSSPQEDPLISNGAHLVALGTVQIMIGVMVFSFGIVTAIPAEYLGASSLSAISGVFVWGAVIYVTAGSFTIAAVKSPTRCLARTSHGFNVVAILTSLVAMGVYGLDGGGWYLMCYDDSSPDCNLYKERVKGFALVLFIFILLESFLLMAVIRLACPSSSNDGDQQELVYVIPINTSQAAHDPPPYHTLPASTAHPTPQMMVSPKPEGYINPGLTEPPPYTLS